jgi:hypothetical protein
MKIHWDMAGGGGVGEGVTDEIVETKISVFTYSFIHSKMIYFFVVLGIELRA